MLINAESLIPLHNAVQAAQDARQALCDAFNALPKPRTNEQNRAFNRDFEPLDQELQRACLLLALHVGFEIERAQGEQP